MKKIQDFKVLNIKKLNVDTFVMILKSTAKLEQMSPGQFLQVEIANSKSTFLRRPISIHDVDYSNNNITLFVKMIGDGTKALGTLESGDLVNIIYPLGNSFSLSKNRKVLLVGGGCGVAPLLYLSRQLKAVNNNVSILLGAVNADGLVRLDDFASFGEVFTTTNDGSNGEKGMVTNHSVFRNLRDFDFVYTCGPNLMMKAVAELAIMVGVSCEVSLENTMACGIGACLCCVQNTSNGNVCVCTDGPVFNANDVIW